MLTGYLLKSNASIIGLQEVRHKQLLDVDRALPNHSSVGVGRSDGKTGGEYSPIFYDRTIWKLDPDQHGTFWLSDTPEVPNSRTWGNRYTRICTWARLIGVKGFADGKVVYVYNTHWDHNSQPARVNSGKLILDTIKSRPHKKDPFILMGDLNANTDNPAVKQLLGSGFLLDHGTEQVRTSSMWKSTFAPGLRIDHIFTSRSFKNAQFTVESRVQRASRLRITTLLCSASDSLPPTKRRPTRLAGQDHEPRRQAVDSDENEVTDARDQQGVITVACR